MNHIENSTPLNSHNTPMNEPEKKHNPSSHNRPQSSKNKILNEILHIAIIAAFVVLPIRLFVAQPFIVSGASMSPTFESGHYLVVDELSYHLDEPERLEVIIFRFPGDPRKFFIKRVIGLPGETVILEGGRTTIINSEHPEGFTLEEPYVTFASSVSVRRELGENEYFVMGDNRQASSDSRIWGPLPRDNIVGRAFLRLLPLGELTLLPGRVPRQSE